MLGDKSLYVVCAHNTGIYHYAYVYNVLFMSTFFSLYGIDNLDRMAHDISML